MKGLLGAILILTVLMLFPTAVLAVAAVCLVVWVLNGGKA